MKKEDTCFQIAEENLIDNYYYYALVTNIFQHEKNEGEILEFYRGRSNGENFIREEKNGLDIKHFPCKKLLANYSYDKIFETSLTNSPAGRGVP
ncbi:MAG: hypothetical protein HQK49_16755 [Oligoflexia bacterium]|nr:hypothetical protein [Oligoflexia bacterium]